MAVSNTAPNKTRYALPDTLRGLTLLSMIAYHGCWDMVYILGADWPWYQSSGAYLWQQSICWTFILLSGFSFSLGRRHWRRGWLVFGCGAVVTAVTLVVMPGQEIWFGVLTLLGSCMLLGALLERPLGRVPAGAGLVLSAALFVLTRSVNRGYLGFEGLRLAALPGALYRNMATAYLGFPFPGFRSTDYFSLVPWLFLFLTGYFLFRLTGQRLAAAPDLGRCAPLEALGRRSLLVYMLHQPVLYGLTMVLRLLA
ncbi:heparan-alpha-glucosaminide N-acetyltransferase domain-containing protein [Dysosmobacter sp.]|uniref:heparan-alpha-glucosaminide N-acetyltransferase domain-containing protein n=1 Tax=Dysosmobacter sp. TaxID=2591382 RepID=UPI003AB27949